MLDVYDKRPLALRGHVTDASFMLEGILLRSNMAAKTTFCLYVVKRLIVMLRCAGNVTKSSFQHFLEV